MTIKFSFRSSSAGKCPKALWAERNKIKGEPKPAWLQDSADEGTIQEAIVKTKLRKIGWEISEDEFCKKCKAQFGDDRKGIHVEITYGNITVFGHMDGTATKDNIKRILEVKTMSQFEFDRWIKNKFDAFPAYASQLTTYMEAYGLNRALYAVKNRNNGHLDITLIDSAPLKFEDVLRNLALSTLEKIPEREPDFNTFECRRCSFKKVLCTKTKEQMVVQNASELDTACQMFRDGTVEIEKGNAKINQAKAILLEHTIAVKMKKYIYNDLAISLTERNYKGYNAKKLEELFTAKQLKPALIDKPIDPYITINDLSKE
jgi:hypothetical protein